MVVVELSLRLRTSVHRSKTWLQRLKEGRGGGWFTLVLPTMLGGHPQPHAGWIRCSHMVTPEIPYVASQHPIESLITYFVYILC